MSTCSGAPKMTDITDIHDVVDGAARTLDARIRYADWIRIFVQVREHLRISDPAQVALELCLHPDIVNAVQGLADAEIMQAALALSDPQCPVRAAHPPFAEATKEAVLQALRGADITQMSVSQIADYFASSLAATMPRAE